MKQLLLLPIVLLSLSLNTGCVSPSAKGPNAALVQQGQTLAAIAGVAAYTGCSIDLNDNPDRLVMYKASKVALDSLIKDENYTPYAFRDALSQLPVRQLAGYKGTLMVGSAVRLWDSYKDQVVNLDGSVFIKPILMSVRDGLRDAINEYEEAHK